MKKKSEKMKIRDMKEFRESGLLWYINRVAFHPRGFALALDINDDGDVTGWGIMGDGKEVWRFASEADVPGHGVDEDGHFAALEKVLDEVRHDADQEIVEDGDS